MSKITKDLKISIVSISEAENYKGAEVELLHISQVLLVEKGMTNGRSSVDIQCENNTGKRFVIMTTGSLIQGLASAVAGVEAREAIDHD